MEDLDKKLKEVLRSYALEAAQVYASDIFTDGAANQIKQSFLDAGWRETKYANYAHLRDDARFESNIMTKEEWEAKAIKDGWVKEVGNIHGVRIVSDPGLMTGQEWYDRFKESLKYDTKKYSNQCEDCGAPHNWEEAAKKAAGIE